MSAIPDRLQRLNDQFGKLQKDLEGLPLLEKVSVYCEHSKLGHTAEIEKLLEEKGVQGWWRRRSGFVEKRDAQLEAADVQDDGPIIAGEWIDGQGASFRLCLSATKPGAFDLWKYCEGAQMGAIGAAPIDALRQCIGVLAHRTAEPGPKEPSGWVLNYRIYWSIAAPKAPVQCLFTAFAGYGERVIVEKSKKSSEP